MSTGRWFDRGPDGVKYDIRKTPSAEQMRYLYLNTRLPVAHIARECDTTVYMVNLICREDLHFMTRCAEREECEVENARLVKQELEQKRGGENPASLAVPLVRSSTSLNISSSQDTTVVSPVSLRRGSTLKLPALQPRPPRKP